MFAIAIAIIVGGYFLIGVGVTAVVGETDRVKEEKTELIGTKTLISTDTLIITEYTWLDNTVSGYLTTDEKLENKVTVSVEFAKKNKIEDESD